MKCAKIFLSVVCVVALSSSTPVKNKFSATEMSQISVQTPGLFAHSNAFSIDFYDLKESDYSFPLPIGKAEKTKDGELKITTKKGDAVKAVFDGTVRLSKDYADKGNVIVVRHDNGLETVYANNAQNLAKVGQRVKAGQTIAIVGTAKGETFCEFAIMVNGGKINPSTIFDIKSHKLRRQTILCENRKNYVDVAVSDVADDEGPDPTPKSEIAKASSKSKLNLSDLAKSEWCYPLPGAKVISAYGGRGGRMHSGVDLKTKANDEIHAAFDGVVTMSKPYFGYGNFIVIKHDNGLETRYSHQSRNKVKAGQRVKAGDVIGYTGRSGRATTEHLHFEVAFNGKRINPNMVFDHLNKSLQQSTLSYAGGKVTSKKNLYAAGK